MFGGEELESEEELSFKVIELREGEVAMSLEGEESRAESTAEV